MTLLPTSPSVMVVKVALEPENFSHALLSWQLGSELSAEPRPVTASLLVTIAPAPISVAVMVPAAISPAVIVLAAISLDVIVLAAIWFAVMVLAAISLAVIVFAAI